MKKSFLFLTFVLLFFHIGSIFSQYSVIASVSDSVSGNPVIDVKGEILETGKVKFSSDAGVLEFNDLKPGVYVLRISAEHYLTKELNFNISDKSISISVSLKPFESSTDTIDVHAKFFTRDKTVSTSYSNTFYEELRKTPGAVEDVVKFFISSPGVSVGWDFYNELIVRGGSPIENLTVIDGLDVPNPNHYGTPGSSSGAISYINLKLVNDVDFFTGGFPSKYGDRISSVMDIKFREGNRKNHIRDVNVSVTGAGAFLEGPITSKSSYMFSFRRSYLELVKSQLNFNLIPEYWDFNLKLNYDLSKSEKLGLIGLFATDNAKPFEEGDYMHDTIRIRLLVSGISYTKQLRSFKYNISLGYNWNFYKVDYDNYKLDINDNEINLKNVIDYNFNKEISLNIFAAVKYIFSDYNISRYGVFNYSNYYSPSAYFNTEIKTYKISAGANINGLLLNKKLTLNFGFRFDSFGIIYEPFTFSPRIGLSYKLAGNLYINGSYGVYYQAPEMLWVAADSVNRHLRSIKSDSYVIGLEYFLAEDIRLNLEGYLKQYQFYPVSVYDPNYIYINSGVDLYPNFLDKAISAGKGYYGGIDFTFQKRNPGSGLFWTVIYSYSKSKFLALAGDYQPALYDYNHQVTAIGGIKLKSLWGFSIRFKYAGSRPYTPFDIEKSEEKNMGIYDKTQFYTGRLPEYVRLDVRIDKSLNIGYTNFTAYFEVQNLLNRDNIFQYRWSESKNKPVPDLHFSILPVIGLSYQF